MAAIFQVGVSGDGASTSMGGRWEAVVAGAVSDALQREPWYLLPHLSLLGDPYGRQVRDLHF